jgi:hypothetical protein
MVVKGMPSEYWGIIHSRKESRGSCGQNGISKVSRTSLQASSGTRWGRLPIPVVEKGLIIYK